MYPRFLTLFVSLICVTSSLAGPVANDVGANVGRAVVPADELLPRQLPVSTVLQVFQELTTQGTPLISSLSKSCVIKAPAEF